MEEGSASGIVHNTVIPLGFKHGIPPEAGIPALHYAMRFSILSPGFHSLTLILSMPFHDFCLSCAQCESRCLPSAFQESRALNKHRVRS